MATTRGIAAPGASPAVSPRNDAGLVAVRRYFEASLFLLLATGVATLVSTGKLDLVSAVVPPVALAYKALRYLHGKGPELSHRAATWLTVAYLVFFPFDLLVISRTLSAGSPNPLLFAALLAAIHLMLFALIVRLYSARTTRDHLFLTMLAFSLMLVAAILTVDTLYLGFFLVFLVLAVSTFVGLEMRRSAEGSVVPPLAAGTPTAKRLQKALTATSTLVAVGALAVGTVIFLILPRVTAGYLSGLNLQPSLISGFSDTVELGQIGTIKKRNAVVMRVRVEGGPERVRGVKWRGIALTTFDGRRWSRGIHEGEIAEPSAQGWYSLRTSAPDIPAAEWQRWRRGRPEFLPAGRLLRYRVLLEPLATDTLFFATHGAAVRGRFAPEIIRAGRRPRGYLLVDQAGSVANPYHNFQRLLYEAQSWVPAVPAERLRAHQIGYSDALKQRYLQLPPLDPRIPELARRITAGAPTAYDKAAALEQYLRARYGYTLDLSGTPPGDPLAHFLFERRAGHCEYFAAAMTVMLRTLAIPARYVNGFLPGEYNDVGEDFIVRASDAHSWVEVFFGEYGWIPFDPTPPANEPPRGLLGSLLHYYDWFELVWSEWVINYDLGRQVTLAQNVQKASREWSERMRQSVSATQRGMVERLKAWHRSLAASPYALLGALLVLASAALLRQGAVRAVLARFWGLHLSAGGGVTPRAATLYYQQMLRKLARSGYAKPPGQTPLEFAASIPTPELAGAVGRLTRLYQSARFGARRTDAHQMSALLESVTTILRSRPRSSARSAGRGRSTC